MRTRIQKTQLQLEQQLQRLPSSEELAEEMNMDTDEVAAALQIGGNHISLDAPFSSEAESKSIVSFSIRLSFRHSGNFLANHSFTVAYSGTIFVVSLLQQ